LVKQAREKLKAGKLEEAKELALKANNVNSVRWGLFEDTPDSVMVDIQKARIARNQEESVRVMAEARKLYEQGKYDEAKKKAYQAETLHGIYSVWDFTDRPQRLIAEIETAESKDRKAKVKVPAVPDVQVAKNDAAKKDQKPQGVAAAPTKPTDAPALVASNTRPAVA